MTINSVIDAAHLRHLQNLLWVYNKTTCFAEFYLRHGNFYSSCQLQRQPSLLCCAAQTINYRGPLNTLDPHAGTEGVTLKGWASTSPAAAPLKQKEPHCLRRSFTRFTNLTSDVVSSIYQRKCCNASSSVHALVLKSSTEQAARDNEWVNFLHVSYDALMLKKSTC